jgi:hypothetical protein
LFIYEPVWNKTPGDVVLEASATGVNKQTLVGNPFMAHLDFDAFYAMNSADIMNYYRVMDETGNFITYTVGGPSTGTPVLGRYIAPMQSFLVTAKGSFNRLYANVEMMAVDAGEKLRSTMAQDDGEDQILSIEVYRGDKINKSLLVLNPNNSNLYEDERDVIKSFVQADTSPVSVYTASSDGMLLDINRIGILEDEIIQLGIRTSEKGTFRLNFGGLTTFAPGYDIWLNELKNNVLYRYNLREGSMHEFEKTDDETFMNNRFYLSFDRSATGITSAEKTVPGIESTVTANKLRVFTTDGSSLRNVNLYDLQGRLIACLKNIGLPNVEMPIQGNRIYIIQATSESSTRSMKVYGR